MLDPSHFYEKDDASPEGDTTVITVTLRPSEIMEATNFEQLMMLKLHDAGAPVTGLEGNLSLKTGYLTLCNNFDNVLTFKCRSK